MPDTKLDDVTKVLKDAVYVTVGLGVIAFQKAQVQRQELRKTLLGRVDEAKGQVQGLGAIVDDRVRLVEERLDAVEERIEAVLDQILPDQVEDLVKQARQAAKDARGQVRGLLRPTSN